MNLVYYAHSYRKPDAPVVEFFSELMRSEGLTVSLDPPSDRLNSAKPERHLRVTDGMVAVLTAREGGVSQYILYEISLCLRAQKPLLVLIEDILPSGLVSSRILQRRFSRRGLLRQIRDHRHAIRTLRNYIGKEPPATYQPSTDMRKCLLGGLHDLPDAVANQLQLQLSARGYDPLVLHGDVLECLYDPTLQEAISSAELALAFVDSEKMHAEFFLGAMRASFVPTILLTQNPDFRFLGSIPREYQARIVDAAQEDEFKSKVDAEIAIVEEEYVDLDNQQQVARYAQLLIAEGSRTGQYAPDTRNIFVQELHMGDKNINYGQAGAMGSHATGAIHNYENAWNQIKAQTDLNALAKELTQLQSTLRTRAQTIEEDKSALAVREAESEASRGNGAGVMEKLAIAGRWALDVAKEIGVKLAAETILKSIGM